MKPLLLTISLLSSYLLLAVCPNTRDYTNLVDPFIGTRSLGASHPGATWPMGMVQPGPDTGAQWPVRSGYKDEDTVLAGFSQNRQIGTFWACLHDVLLLPFTGETPPSAPANSERHLLGMMDKATERAEPGYYAVSLTNFGVRAELTASRRVAYHRYTFEKGGTGRILLDLQSGPLSSWGGELAKPPRVIASESAIGEDGVVAGVNRVKCHFKSRTVAFALAFSRKWATVQELGDNGWPGKRYVFDFDVSAGEAVEVKVALSTVDENGARLNLAGDPPGFDFAARRNDALGAWRKLLSCVDVEGCDERRRVFYSMLYQSFVQPALISDADGRVRLDDGKVHKVSFPYFTGYLDTWDTFRAAHPLYTVLAPKRATLFARTLIENARMTGGKIPSDMIWGLGTCIMPGSHGIPIVLDAFEKGLLPGYSAKEVVERAGDTLWWTGDLAAKGWYPLKQGTGSTVSTQLDEVADAWCVMHSAAKHGVTGGVVDRAIRVAGSWTNVFDAATGFIRPKDEAGKWVEPFDRWQQCRKNDEPWGFNEGGYAQWAWHVLGDPEALIAAHGGKARAAADLDAIFDAPERIDGQQVGYGCTGQIGQYFHGNEPTHHMAYLYQYMDRGDRTAELVRDICTKLYANRRDGMCGDGDSGQMGAWYVLSSLGFYQVKPVGGEFVLGAPQYPKLTVHLENGKTLTILADGFSADNRHVSSVTLNGRPLKGFISYAEIMAGGTLVFTMTR